MTMTDPIADMLTRVRNANVAMHETVRMPSSKLKEALAVILEREGYIAGFTTVSSGQGPGDVLEIALKYTPDRSRRDRRSKARLQAWIAHLRRADGLPRVLGGLGVAVLSTSKGLMTDREARQQRVGGEVLCYVW